VVPSGAESVGRRHAREIPLLGARPDNRSICEMLPKEDTPGDEGGTGMAEWGR